MSRSDAILATLVGYKILLIVIGLWASRRTSNQTDFFLGGRRLGPVVAAISASASSSSAWTLLGVSGAAFAWGLPAIWLIPATVLGFCINWYLIAPRLARASRASGALTLTEFIAGPPGDPARRTMMRLGAAVILFSFTFYIAAQFQAAGKTFASVLEVQQNAAIVIGAVVGEFAGASAGLGVMISVADGQYDTARMFVGVLALVALVCGTVLPQSWSASHNSA